MSTRTTASLRAESTEMKRLRFSWVLAVVACPSLARAEVGAMLAVTNDYDFRGETQTSYGPAAQLSLEVRDDVGWKAGLFTSNVNFGANREFGNPRLEMSPYVEFAAKIAADTTVGAGAAYYAYALDGGSSYDYGEFYLTGGYKTLKSALYYAPDEEGRSTHMHLSAWYWSADGSVPLSERWSLLAHMGYAWGAYWAGVGGGTKVDYSTGINYSIGKFEVLLQYIDSKRTSRGANGFVNTDINTNTKGRAVLSIETGLPW